MATTRKNTPVTPADRKARNGRLKRHLVPTSPGDRHMGATESQVSKTMPPKADDDEPKQG